MPRDVFNKPKLFGLSETNVELGYAANVVGLSLTAALQDIPGCSIGITVPNRPFVLKLGATIQTNKGTAATSDRTMVVVTLFDTSNMATAILSAISSAPAALAGPLQNSIYAEQRMSLPSGTTKTYKLQAQTLVTPTGGGGAIIASNAQPCWIGAFSV